MSIPQNKEELLEVVHKKYRKLREELDPISVSLVRKKTVEGDVSVADIVAYQIG